MSGIGVWVGDRVVGVIVQHHRLLDRDAEFDELVGFCAGEQPYA